MISLNDLTASFTFINQQTQENFLFLLVFILIPWLIFFINLLLGKRLFYFGIFPRQWVGVPGILLAPLLHGNFNHLFFNTIPLFVLADFVLMGGRDLFILITLFIIVVSGSLTWLFGKPGIHIGASGLITGYWAFLVSALYYNINLVTMILGLLSLYYFMAIFLGLIPKKGVSWEGHLFGLIAGLSCRLLLFPT